MEDDKVLRSVSMKMILVISLLCLASVSFAANNSGKVGQKDSSNDSDPCNKPEIIGCGPCYKQCLEQNSVEGAKADTSRGSSTSKNRKGSATKQ
jgi:hypothetical protein